MSSKIVKEFTYKNRKCIVCLNTKKCNFDDYLTAYAFLPELEELYEKEVAQEPDFFERSDLPLHEFFNFAGATWFGTLSFDNPEYDNKLCCGIDLAHFHNFEYGTNLRVATAEDDIRELVDCLEANYGDWEKTDETK